MNDRKAGLRLLVLGDDAVQAEALASQARPLLRQGETLVLKPAEAMDFMDRLAQAPQDKPDLIFAILDPRQVTSMAPLVEARRNPRLAEVPLVVFSKSESAYDISALYGMHMNCVLSASRILANPEEARSVLHYWMELAALPSA